MSLKNSYNKIIAFLSHDIWHLDSAAYSKKKALGLHYLKTFIITAKSFSTKRVGQQAAALTFFTMIAIVPFVAVVYAITKGFGFAKELEDLVYANFSEREDVIQWVLQIANNILDTSKSGLFGLIGFITFFWSIIWVMINVETSLNLVWQVKSSRSIARKFLIYLGLIIVSPILIISSFAISLTYNEFINNLGLNIYFLHTLTPLVTWLLLALFAGLIFFLAFKYIPNTQVRVVPAMNAAILIGIAFVAVQFLYVETQVFVSRLNAVYGAFAAIPLFMMWLNTNWFLLLLGAELSFAFQNVDRYEFEEASSHISARQRQLSALIVMRLIAKRFKEEFPPLNMDQITAELNLPLRLVHNIIQDLLACSLLVELSSKSSEAENTFIPAVELQKLSILFVLNKLENYGETRIIDSIRPDMQKFTDLIQKMRDNIETTDLNKLIYQI